MENITPKNINNLPANPVPLYKRITRDELQKLIYENYGMTSMLVVKLDANFKQVWNAIHKYKLEDDIEQAKQMFNDKAKTVLLDAMDSNDENTRLKAAIAIYSKNNQPQTVVQTQINVDKDTQIKSIFGIK